MKLSHREILKFVKLWRVLVNCKQKISGTWIRIAIDIIIFGRIFDSNKLCEASIAMWNNNNKNNYEYNIKLN